MKYTTAVRNLCNFAAKHGDLDLRFTPSPTAMEGMEGHAAVRAKRTSAYLSELSLTGEHRNLLVRGRADGYDAALNRLEEIKTFRGNLDTMPANYRSLHWAQAKIYGHLLCQQRQLKELDIALVYFDIDQHTETVLLERYTAESLEQHFVQLCDRFVDWADQEMQHRSHRDRSLSDLSFPHASFRPAQRQLAETVYKATRQQRCLLAQAPTGIGKTVGTLFPMLKAMPTENLDKIFFLTAKTSGRQLAVDTLLTLANSHPEPKQGFMRVLELTARDKACEHIDKACHGASCPLAAGFYDKLPAARQEAVDTGMLDKTTLRHIALKHQVCPYWLGHDLAMWSDVIIGDYNHYFDSSAMLYNLSGVNQWRVGVLADEAHNLLERARKMYSAELNEADLLAAQRECPASLKRTFTTLLRAWRYTYRDQEIAYKAYTELPPKLLAALLLASRAIGDFLQIDPLARKPVLQRFHFDVLHFLRLADVFGSHSIFDMTLPAGTTGDASTPSARLCIRNMIPAPFLEQRFTASHSVTLFSATLSPWHFYRETLGLPENTAWLDVESPFQADQLQVKIVPQISTRFQDRKRSLSPIAQLMAGQYQQSPGNYLSYFSSFDYLEQVVAEFIKLYPHVPVWQQSRSMSETNKEQFLARFTAESQGIGFAVLGGAFAEGIDLPGNRLIGAFVSTLGLPQINAVNEQLKKAMEQTFGTAKGYDYTYLYPGIQKVVQAAGRVIRSHTDSGTVYLIDDRYTRPNVQALFPRWWQLDRHTTLLSSQE